MSRNLPYDRAERIAGQIFEVASSFVYRELNDPRLQGIQLTRATLTRDLSIARIYYHIEGGKTKLDSAKKALNEVKGMIRHQIGVELVLKSVPKIDFYVDEGVENARRISEILGQINK